VERIKPFVPAFISFGPLFMVMGSTGTQLGIASQIFAYAGAFMLSLGCGWLYMASKSSSR
jgi:hypothetical protein